MTKAKAHRSRRRRGIVERERKANGDRRRRAGKQLNVLSRVRALTPWPHSGAAAALALDQATAQHVNPRESYRVGSQIMEEPVGMEVDQQQHGWKASTGVTNTSHNGRIETGRM